ncbi:MAG: hypothetical protein KBE91_08500 [Bacteroidia bacterium]|nr:hypothetical protein [Bacteroidia bacterium]MBP9689636.1 hypothetical protein [Bacteroidia bacterium]
MDDLDNLVNEPLFPYNSIKRVTFKSLEEEDRAYSLSLTPLQRMHYMHLLTLNAYGAHTALVTEIAPIIYTK